MTAMLSIPAPLQAAQDRVVSVLTSVMPTTLAIAAVFTIVALWTSQACNSNRPWWRNRGLATDAWYWLVMPFVTPYIRMALLIAGATLIAWMTGVQKAEDYLLNGYGMMARTGFWFQLAVYVIATDFLLYWAHRLFHGRDLWRYHAVHHSALDVDWTTSYRVHPVNLWAGPTLVTTLMLLAGIAPAVLVFWAPVDAFMAAFVHANLKWKLGPLKYVIASPVFHRWHHTEEACETNYAPSFALWDVLFGTFFMPEGRLPELYGVGNADFPQEFLGQLAYPFQHQETHAAANTAP